MNLRLKTLLGILFIANLTLFGQTQSEIQKGKITIPIKTEINFSFKEKRGKFKNFEIIAEKDLTEPSKLMNAMSEKPENFEGISIKFNESDFGIILILIHKLKEPIIYKARIKIKGRSGLVDTTIHPSHPNVLSIEQWKDDIEAIELFDFEYYNE
jgi:hypothetical protein